jgi:4-oxalocrotonate tautomerase
MPLIIFEGPRLPKDKKRELIRLFADAAHNVTGIHKEAFTTVLHENEQDNIGVGGELLSDRLAKQSGD